MQRLYAETICKEQMTNGYPKAKKEEFVPLLGIIQVKST